ncbi:MAG: hypothetical protein GC157_11100 [Frankiales bacterium]|nr:hypothetical protein [Frankiales bacterium]
MGIGSGDYNWSRPVPMPAPPYGSAPALSLQYSSAEVDGMTFAANQQSSTVGVGWELGAPYIERSFAPCNSYLSSNPSNGDLCYPGLEVVHLVNGASSTPMVQLQTGTDWRLQSDQGWTVERRSTDSGNGTSNTDDKGEYWIVTDPNGVQYWYGFGHEKPGGTPGAATNSVLTVPVDGGSSACSGGATWCTLAYRWYLDRVVDTHGVQATYYYDNEAGYYRSMGQNHFHQIYDRAAQLNRIDYGQDSSSPGTTVQVSVKFDYEKRCSNQAGTSTTNWNNCASDATDEPDVPTDQLCWSTQTYCSTSQEAPTFFTQKLLRQIGAFTTHSGTQAVWLERFFYTFPDPGDGTGASLWLTQVQHIGVPSTFTWKSTWAAADYNAVTGQIALPAVKFYSVGEDGSTGLLANRRDTTTSVPPMNHYRVREIQNELGGRTWITYDTDTSCPDAITTWDTQATRCYPTWWSPPGVAPGYGVFYKYTVSRVAVSESTTAAGSVPDVVSTYTYNDSAAWHFQDIPAALGPKDASNGYADKRTWSDWRGYRNVRVDTGSHSTSYQVFRGMQGDKKTGIGCTYSAPLVNGYTDYPYLEGRTAVVSQLRSNGVANSTVTYQYATAATHGDPNDPNYCTQYDHVAYLMVNTVADTATSEGFASRDTTLVRSYDVDGRLTSERTNASVSGSSLSPAYSADGTANYMCTTTEYATGAALLPSGDFNDPARVKSFKQTVGSTCAVGSAGGTLIGESDTYYDGHTSLFTAATAGDPTKVDAYKASSAKLTTTTAYDVHGRATSTTNPYGATTTTAYSPTSGWPNSVTVTDPLSHTSSTTLDTHVNQPATVTDQAGHVTTLKYDNLGRLLCVYLPQNPSSILDAPGCQTATAAPNMRYTYTNAGSDPARVETDTRITDGSTPTMVAQWDFYTGFGKPLETQKVNPGATTHALVTKNWYNADGLVSNSIAPANVNGTPGGYFSLALVASNALDETRTSYDEFGRPTLVATYSSNAIVTGSDGQPESTTTSYTAVGSTSTPATGGGSTSYTDALGRPVDTYAQPDGTGSALHVTYTYNYNSAGDLRVTRTTPATTAGATPSSTTESDWTGRPVSVQSADAGTTTTVYDQTPSTPDGTHYETVTSPTSTLTYDYDKAGRPTDVKAGSSTVRSWTYDATGAVGLLATDKSTSGGGDWNRSYAYDNAGRLATLTVTPPSGSGFATSYPTSYTTGEAGQTTSVTYPDTTGAASETVAYGYDAYGDPTTVTGTLGANTTTYVTATSQTNTGQLATRTYQPNATAWTRTYQYTPGDRRVSDIQLASASTTAEHDTLHWDSVGNLTSVTDTTTNQTACYGYDAYWRLTGARTTSSTSGTACNGINYGTAGTGPVPWSYQYTYDDAGDITSLANYQTSTTTNYAYPSGGSTPNLPTTIGGQTVTPDAAGRVTTLGTTTLTWDPFGMAATTTAGGTTSTNSYAVDGSRIQRQDGTTNTTLFLPDQEISKNSSGTLSYVRYIHQGGATVAVRTANTTAVISASDIQNTPAININGANTITRRYTTPYGAQITSTGDTLSGQRRFLGQVEDPTGLLSDSARTYSPSFGIFLAPDPMAASAPASSASAYAYGGDSPATLSDPTGLMIAGIEHGDGANQKDFLTRSQMPSLVLTDTSYHKSIYGGSLGDYLKGMANGAWQLGPGFLAMINHAFPTPINHWEADLIDQAHAALEQWGGADTSSSAYQNGTDAGIALGSILSLGAGAVVAGEAISTEAIDFTATARSAASADAAAETAAELPEGYSSFSAAKRAMGSPGEGNVFDHVVEQSQIGRSGFAPEEIHNPFNMNPVSARANQLKANYYSTKQPFTEGGTVRDWLTGQSFQDQYQFGMDVLRQIASGVLQ